MSLSSLLAYIDPVPVSMLLQAIAMGIVGGAIIFRNWILRVFSIIFRFGSRK